MSFNYDRYDRRQPAARTRSTFGYWMPLVLTVTVATAGLAAWVWSERRDDEGESDEDENLSYGEESDRKRRAGPSNTTPHAPLDRDTTGLSHGVAHPDDLMARVQGVIRRTPSPQQVFDTVSKKTAAGWAAAGAALASIREEDKDDAYGDHSRWSEEAAIRRSVEAQSAQSSAPADGQARAFAASVRSGGRRKTVVLVVSADALDTPDDPAYSSEHATLLSHLPSSLPANITLFILIHTPTSRSSRPPSNPASRSRSPLGSSYSAISTPFEDLSSVDPTPYTPPSTTALHHTLQTQAQRLVTHPSMVMPFSTPSGFVHIVRHLGAELVYVVDALSGPQGQFVGDLRRWVAQTVVVVGEGVEGGGLVDTDDESMVEGKERVGERKWWERDEMVGLGKGVEVVDVVRFGEDFERRVVKE